MRSLLGLGGLAAVAAVALFALNRLDESPVDGEDRADPRNAELVKRGAYLVTAGNCAGCHTARHEPAFAGGVPIETPFGRVYASNLTPDRGTGIGDWTAGHFWRALHNGRSRDGRLLTPAFPYPNYTRISRDDSDAMLAWLRTLPPVSRPNTPHALRFPYDSQVALAVWRALNFRPVGSTSPAPPTIEDPARASPQALADRGAYLVNALGHCNACHSSRNLLGATVDTVDLGGGLIPMQNWYAPSLTSANEASVADWPVADIVALLGTGISPRGSVSGPMADVVFRSTQHLRPGDLLAMATWLKRLPATPAHAVMSDAASATSSSRRSSVIEEGRSLYREHCASCHGDNGEGIAGAYPALAGNRSVVLNNPVNLVRTVVAGGFSPATAGNPRPFGMPPFATQLNDRQIAAILTAIRNSWGNQAADVAAQDVSRYR